MLGTGEGTGSEKGSAAHTGSQFESHMATHAKQASGLARARLPGDCRAWVLFWALRGSYGEDRPNCILRSVFLLVYDGLEENRSRSRGTGHRLSWLSWGERMVASRGEERDRIPAVTWATPMGLLPPWWWARSGSQAWETQKSQWEPTLRPEGLQWCAEDSWS